MNGYHPGEVEGGTPSRGPMIGAKGGRTIGDVEPQLLERAPPRQLQKGKALRPPSTLPGAAAVASGRHRCRPLQDAADDGIDCPTFRLREQQQAALVCTS